MRFSLSLNGWPPLASHTAALLLGVALANSSWGQGEIPLQLKPKSVAFSLNSGQVQWLDQGRVHPGMEVHLLKRSTDGEFCRLSTTPWIVMTKDANWIISTQMREAEICTGFFKALSDKQLSFSGSRQSSLIRSCQHSPRVIYGSTD